LRSLEPHYSTTFLLLLSNSKERRVPVAQDIPSTGTILPGNGSK